MGVERGHGAPRGRTETDHYRAQAATVVTGQPGELQRVENRAVPGDLVVLVEHVQADRSVASPVVHGLEGDQGQSSVDCELRELGVLHAVRPAPQHLPGVQRGDVRVLWLGKQHDIGVGQDLVARREPGDVLAKGRVADAELRAVPVLEGEASP